MRYFDLMEPLSFDREVICTQLSWIRQFEFGRVTKELKTYVLVEERGRDIGDECEVCCVRIK